MQILALGLASIAALASVAALLVVMYVSQQTTVLMRTTEEVHKLTNSTMSKVRADLAQALADLASAQELLRIKAEKASG